MRPRRFILVVVAGTLALFGFRLLFFMLLTAGVTSTPAGLDKKDADRIIAKAMEGFWGVPLDTTVRFCSPPMTRSVKVS